MRDDSAEILFQSFLQEALVSSSGMGKYVRSLMWPIQHFLSQPRRLPPSKVLWRMVLERLFWSVTCRNHESFRLPAVIGRGSYGPTRKSILLLTLSLILCSTYREVALWVGFRKPGLFFGVSKQGPCLTTVDKDGGDKRLLQREHVCEAYGAAPADSV